MRPKIYVSGVRACHANLESRICGCDLQFANNADYLLLLDGVDALNYTERLNTRVDIIFLR